MNAKQTLMAGTITMFLAVAIGAFGAHGLNLNEHQHQIFETGVKYQFYHALGLLLSGVLMEIKPGIIHRFVPILFVGGILFFSGSLYLLILSEKKWFGAITPLGGVMFLIAWCLFTLHLAKNKF